MCPLVITFLLLIKAVISESYTEAAAVNIKPNHDPVPPLDTFNYVSANIRNGSISSVEARASNATELYSPVTEAFESESAISSNCETNSTDTCPILCGNFDDYSQNVVLDKLLDPCRYDSDVIPPSENLLEVQVRVQVTYTEIRTESQLLKTCLQVAFGYSDPRLAYHFLSPNREVLMGEEMLIKRIWTPHIYVLNEKTSNLMGFDKSDMYVTIDPYGKVELNQRVSLNTHCWMDLMKFPFDEQTCSVDFQLWSYDVTKLILRWREDNPVILSPNLYITEFDLNDYKAEEVVKLRSIGLNHENVYYSTLRLEFNVSRQIGYYIMDFFIPSILLVITSWVSFWLQADASPARVALGTSTMLAFITLTLGQYSNFPKVPYVTLGEIWFIGCTIFIFLSITEFAFANVIWRRKKQVELLKFKSKNILKSALTPSLARRDVMNTLNKSQSYSSFTGSFEERSQNTNTFIKSARCVSASPHNYNVKPSENRTTSSAVTLELPNQEETLQTPPVIYLSPKDVAIWIDKKSRILFPCAFLIFNVIYWTFVSLI